MGPKYASQTSKGAANLMMPLFHHPNLSYLHRTFSRHTFVISGFCAYYVTLKPKTFFLARGSLNSLVGVVSLDPCLLLCQFYEYGVYGVCKDCRILMPDCLVHSIHVVLFGAHYLLTLTRPCVVRFR